MEEAEKTRWPQACNSSDTALRKFWTMTAVAIIFLLLFISVLGWLVYTLHMKMQKVEQNQAIMLGWFDTIKKNEETLQGDIKKLFNEYRSIEEEIQKGLNASKAKESVRPR